MATKNVHKIQSSCGKVYFKVGDSITLKDRPKCWPGDNGLNNPMLLDYPRSFKIKNLVLYGLESNVDEKWASAETEDDYGIVILEDGFSYIDNITVNNRISLEKLIYKLRKYRQL